MGIILLWVVQTIIEINRTDFYRLYRFLQIIQILQIHKGSHEIKIIPNLGSLYGKTRIYAYLYSTGSETNFKHGF